MDPHPCPLEAMFLALEQVLPLFRRRRQATLLKQVRPAVEGMCGRSFTRQHLARIVYVQPGTCRYSLHPYRLGKLADLGVGFSGFYFCSTCC